MSEAEPTVAIDRMSWVEFRDRVAAGAIVIVPVGALEQHGHHLPLGVDAILAVAIAERVARRVDGLVAPVLAYGYKSQPRTGGGDAFPGTTGLDAATLIHLVRDVVRQFARHGATRLAVIDGHYENEMFLTEGIDLALRELRAEGVDGVRVVKLRYFEEVPEATIAAIWPNGYPGLALEHAALMETSMMLAVAPETVRLAVAPVEAPASFPPYDTFPADPAAVPAAGALSPPHQATAEIGVHLVEVFVDLVAGAIEREFR
jgi:creatinine amidohydrolase